MYKAKPIKLTDGTEVFLCETSEHFEGIEADVVYVFEEDELEPDCKALVNAVNIIRDRARQEIKKSETDEHGYRFLRAKKRLKEKGGHERWLIKKETPYSINMDIELVFKLIEKDLIDYYNFVKVASHKMHSRVGLLSESDKEILKDYKDKPFSFEIDEITASLGKGLYEVSYWATGVI